MRIPAIRCLQNGRTLYMASICAGDLIRVCTTDEWNPDLGWDLTVQGYQRTPKPDHVHRIAQFLAANPSAFMPNGALAAARESEFGILRFEPTSNDDTPTGYLTIPEGRLLWLVDYQHRWRGLMEAVVALGAEVLNNMAIPITIIADIPRAEEIEQFYLINSTQKRVDSDLGLALIQTLSQNYSEQYLLNLVPSGKRFRV